MAKKAAPDVLRIAVAQLNPTVGDIAGNLAKAREARADAARQGADLILFTELFIAGYPPEDLVLKPAFLAACERAVGDFAKDTADGGPGVIIGTPLKRNSLHNSIVVADGGKVIAERFKVDLPNYGEFDEKRVFQAGPDMPGPVNFRGVRLGIPICEDIWGDLGVCETLAESGAEMLLVPNGSPYYRGKVDVRQQVAIRQVIESGLPTALGQPARRPGRADLRRRLLRDQRRQVAGLPDEPVRGDAGRHRVEADRRDGWVCVDGPMSKIPEKEEADYRACMLGLRDYVNKNGFKNVVLGLSGGIDSAICAALAVDALGEERLRAVMMPYRYTSKDSLKDAEDCARALGCRYDIVPIFEPVDGFSACADAALRRYQGRHHRGEPAEPRARHHPDGDLQQVRLDGGDDRQQVGDVGRLRHALRRHERRLQSDQGSLQDAGLCAGCAGATRPCRRARSGRRAK